MTEAMTVVFAGPSVPPAARMHHHGLVWRPPAARGDLDALHLPMARAWVVLIDGLMVRDHPPSPSEVYRLIERGCDVWGCSSLGALRAVELRHLGMRGYGWVYDRVLDQTITADDELVAPLDPRSGMAVGLFLANLRFGLDQAVARGLATAQQRQVVLGRLSGTYFEQRTVRQFQQVAGEAGLSETAQTAVLASDVKQRDARQLLGRLLSGELAA